MRLHASLRPVVLFVGCLTGALAGPEEEFARQVRAHTTYLADNLLEGRGAGTRGYDLAARYVASQFARIGLEPGAGDRYEQPVKFIETTTELEAGRFIIRHDGKEVSLAPINEVLVGIAAGRTEDSITAPAVFVGFGVHAPELGHDDFAGADLRGRIVVVLSGAPKQFPSTQRAHHSSSELKRELAVARGAVGFVTIRTPWDEARYPWAFVLGQARFPSMRLLDANGAVVDAFPQLRAGAFVNRSAADALFAASGHQLADVFAQAEAGQALAFPLNVEISLGGKATARTVESANVLGWLPGSDPALAGEPVVITGHLDHLGIGPTSADDTIFNGTMDNAVGIGIILAAAERLAAGPRPARPVLFAALTAEEKGLLGARHLATNLPARATRYAANINIDMPLLLAPTRSLITWGAEHSTLGSIAATAARRAGWVVTPDPMPEETIFVRSDQYRFVQAGVPALYLSTGQQALDPATDLAGMWGTFLRQRYHKPSDDLTQPIDWPSVGAFTAVTAEIIRDIANATPAPAWLPGDFFGGLYGRKD
jgi:Zn-dependent M28 family amino/carboxypeptidase